MDKNIVFVLGAGFSKAAGLPLQRELLPEIIGFERGDLHFVTVKDNIKRFISENFKHVEKDKLTLEDLFTILDKAVVGKEYFGGYEWKNLYEIRRGLVHALLVLINSKIEENKPNISSYKEMGQFIINCQLKRNSRDHNIGIICLNWDTIFESVFNTLGAEKKENNIELDYCVPYDLIDGKNRSNRVSVKEPEYLKIMKLHGSINWLHCPHCGRLYIERFRNIGVNYKTLCSYCLKIYKDREIILEEMIITPTMLKEFHNHHLKLIWQKAFIELNQANVVIFIGYSFPIADYELRYLFKKALTETVKLEAVLHHADETNGTKERYENFFGNHVEFDFNGFEKWWKQFNF